MSTFEAKDFWEFGLELLWTERTLLGKIIFLPIWLVFIPLTLLHLMFDLLTWINNKTSKK